MVGCGLQVLASLESLMRSLPKIQRCQSEPTLGRDYMQSAADGSDFAFAAPPVTSPRTPLNTQPWGPMFTVLHKTSAWPVCLACVTWQWPQTTARRGRQHDPAADSCKYIFRADLSALYSYLPRTFRRAWTDCLYCQTWHVVTDVIDRSSVYAHIISYIVRSDQCNSYHCCSRSDIVCRLSVCDFGRCWWEQQSLLKAILYVWFTFNRVRASGAVT